MKPERPYYGITGIRSSDEAETLLGFINELGIPESHQLMLGYLVSWRGLAWGELADPVQYLLPDEVGSALIEDRRLLNVLHYNSRAGALTRQLDRLLELSPRIDGIQLNICWPDPAELARIRARSYTRLILQLGPRALAEVGRDAGRLKQRLSLYHGVIDDILLDPSGGVGRDFGTTTAALLTAVREAGFERYGIAGGLNDTNLIDRMMPLLGSDLGLSFDAQSGLRNSTGELDIQKCYEYLRGVSQLIMSMTP